jgi:hypothetical protein
MNGQRYDYGNDYASDYDYSASGRAPPGRRVPPDQN